MELKHSGLGISSFVISLVSVVIMFVLFVFSALMYAESGGAMDETAPQVVMLGLFIIITLLLSVVGLGLGIGGLFQKERRKLFAILGSCFSGSLIVITIGVMILGSM